MRGRLPPRPAAPGRRPSPGRWRRSRRPARREESQPRTRSSAPPAAPATPAARCSADRGAYAPGRARSPADPGPTSPDPGSFAREQQSDQEPDTRGDGDRSPRILAHLDIDLAGGGERRFRPLTQLLDALASLLGSRLQQLLRLARHGAQLGHQLLGRRRIHRLALPESDYAPTLESTSALRKRSMTSMNK